MNEYNAGEIWEAVKGETVTRGRLHLNGKYLWVGDSGRTPENLESYGFTLRLIEKAAAVVVLPTEPGLYTTNIRDLTRSVPLYRLNENGEWSTIWPQRGEETRTPAEIRDGINPETLHPLKPVSETAKKVLDRVRILRHDAEAHDLSGASTRDMLRELINVLAIEFEATK